ncbi:MAG: hotdog domain-containing protein [bacterium]|nr:hotdog domain-containing protein [bacterium]
MNHEHLSRTDIEQVLPHRRPFMFLESVDVLEPGKHAVGILADLRDPDFDFLKGHFPDFRIVPGAIIMEALAELLGVTAAFGLSEADNKIGVLVEDRMRYRQMVKPGDPVRLEAEVTNMRRNIGRGNVKALLGDKVAAEGEITFALIDRVDLTI